MDMKDFIAEPWNFRRKLWSWIKCCRLVPPSRSALGMKEVPTLDEGSVSLLWLKAKGSSLSPGLLILWEWEWMEMQEWMAEGAASSWLGGRAAVSPWHPRNPPGPNSRLWGIPGIQQILLSPASCCPSQLCSLPQLLYSKSRSPVSLLLFPAQGWAFLLTQQLLLRHFLCPRVAQLCWTLSRIWLRWGGFRSFSLLQPGELSKSKIWFSSPFVPWTLIPLLIHLILHFQINPSLLCNSFSPALDLRKLN